MRKDAQAVLLLLIGATLLKISFTGTYVRYVKPGLLPLLLIAGAVLIVIAGVTLAQVIRAPKLADEPDPDASDDDELGFGHLAEPVESPSPSPSPSSSSSSSSSSSPSREAELPPTLASLREPDPSSDVSSGQPALPPTLASLREPPALPPTLASLRSPDRSGAWDPVDRTGSWDPRNAEFAEEITYREYTPGELVAVPASHHRRARDFGDLSARRGLPSPHDEPPSEDEPLPEVAYAHAHSEPRIAWLLLVPALALLMFAPPALGSFQASRNGTALSSQADSDFPPLPAGDPLRISMLDYAGRAVFDQGRSLVGRKLVLSGFVIAGPHGESYLARMIVTCCAADGRPVKVGLAGELPTALKPDQWIEVEGIFVDRADKDPVNLELVPYIQVTQIRNIQAPEQQYES